MGAPEDNGETWVRVIFDKIIIQNFLELLKDMNPQIQKHHQSKQAE